MYKLYTDKQETFECDLFLEGADLKQSSARIVVESKDLTLMFKGTIDNKGNCKVPIKKLKGLMSENTTGDIKLEVIAEDTLIEPWQSNFIVDTAKKVTVEVKSQKQSKLQIKESTKPQVKVKSVKNYVNPINEMVNTLIENNITIGKVSQNKKKIAPILKNYAKTINYKGGTQKFIKEVINKLAKT
tara:strand:+ start:60 stop:617 length:558 start_codon:yes stop_codon:yes gene_type:complete